jgi:23S rRNA pseudouridine1911/1915/1917 synthase
MNEIEVLYEDADLLALNKPAGVMVHEDGRNAVPTLVDWIRQTYPECVGVGEPMRLQNGTEIDRPGIVHRLDTDTSGVLLVARTQSAFLHLKEQFMGRTIEKSYRAFVYGRMKHDRGVIDRLIGRASTKNGPPRWSAERTAKGTLREAVTEYQVLARGSAHSYVEARPKTGRTHQIRVHLKALQHPIICDPLYAPKRPCELGFARLALHAHTLSYLALNEERRTIEAPLPADFVHAAQLLAAAQMS